MPPPQLTSCLAGSGVGWRSRYPVVPDLFTNQSGGSLVSHLLGSVKRTFVNGAITASSPAAALMRAYPEVSRSRRAGQRTRSRWWAVPAARPRLVTAAAREQPRRSSGSEIC